MEYEYTTPLNIYSKTAAIVASNENELLKVAHT